MEIGYNMLIIGVEEYEVASKVADRCKLEFISLDEHSSILNYMNIINPSIEEVRFNLNISRDYLLRLLLPYDHVLLIADLSSKVSIASMPLLVEMCKEYGKEVYSIIAMPYNVNDLILYRANYALNVIDRYSDCSVLIDREAIARANPDLTIKDHDSIVKDAMLIASTMIAKSKIEGSLYAINARYEEEFYKLIDSLLIAKDMINTDEAFISIYDKAKIRDAEGVVNSIKDVFESKADVEFNDSNSILIIAKADRRFDRYDPLSKIDSVDDSIESMLKINLQLHNME